MRLTPLAVWLFPLSLACGCQVSPGEQAVASSPTAGSTLRLIVKMRDPNAAAPTYASLQRQARERGMRLAFLRISHDGVYIYQLSGVADDNAMRDYLKTVSMHRNIEYVEPDRILRHQKPNNEVDR